MALQQVLSEPTGYTPQQIQNAYGVNQIKFSGGTVAGNGAGQTIAIVDAYNDPNITSDLAKFDSEFGLFAPASFTVDNLGASTTNAGWALETSLDVEWAHAVAPKANIVLVEASSASLSSLFNAVIYARDQPGVSVVSMSWGTTEFWGESAYDSICTTPAGHTGVTFVAASGDSGAWDGPMYPSVSPKVLAVGGTSLTLAAGSTYGSETGWSDSTGGSAASTATGGLTSEHPRKTGVIAPVPGIMRLFWAFSSSNPPESPSQEDSSLANMLDTLEARCRSDGPPAGPRSIDPLPGSRSFLTVSAVA